MTEFLPAMPHGPVTELFPDVFMVTGGFRFGPAFSITRNMTIVRQGKSLTVINSVRLSPEGEAELEKLGKLEHVVRIGAFHGADDPYYVSRFGAKLWAPARTRHHRGIRHDHELGPGNTPIERSSVFLFEKGRAPEATLRLDHEGGVLVSCDSYQNWTSFEGCSLLGRVVMRAMGFGPTLIGGPWTKHMGPAVREDFDRLLEEPFEHLIPGHGAPLRKDAKAGLRKAIARRFGG